MRSFVVLVSVVLLAVSVEDAFGGCGCRHSQPAQPPPCEQKKPAPSSAPSCGEPKGCPPCATEDIAEPCPKCAAPVQPKCGPCPAPKRPPPCQVCKKPKPCPVCEDCPEPKEPEPCPTCPAPPPPPKCPACPKPEEHPEPKCPSHPASAESKPSCPSRARPMAVRPHLGNDCCNQCGSSCFVRRRALGAATLVVDIDPTCNSEKLRHIILRVRSHLDQL